MKTPNIIYIIKKINLLLLLAIMSCGYSQPKHFKFELVRTFNPWLANQDPWAYPPVFFNGEIDQFFIHRTEFINAVIDLGEHNSLPDDPVHDTTYDLNEAPYEQLFTSKFEKEPVQGQFYKGTTSNRYAIIGETKREGDVITEPVFTLWEIFKDKKPIQISEFYNKYNYLNTYYDFYINEFIGFNRDGNLMFEFSHNIALLSQKGEFITFLLSDNSLDFVNGGLGMNNIEVIALKDDKYLLIKSNRLVLIQFGKQGKDQILLDMEYTEPRNVNGIVNFSESRFTFMADNNMYSINLETGEKYLELSSDEIGFDPEGAISYRILNDGVLFFTACATNYCYKFFTYKWVQSEEKTLLRLEAEALDQNFSLDEIHDINWPYFLTSKITWKGNTVDDIVYQIYQWKADYGLGLDEAQKDNSIGVSPNPVKNILTINAKQTIDNISIYNIMGQKVKSCNSITNNKIDVSSFPNGLYILNAEINGTNQSNKFLKI